MRNLTIIVTDRGDFYKAFLDHDSTKKVDKEFVYNALGIEGLNGFRLERYIHAYLGEEFRIEAWELDIS